MKKIFTVFSLLTVIFLYSLSSTGQDTKIEKGSGTKEISATDKAVIIEIFKTLDPKDYYLEFNNKEVYGLKAMQPSALFAIKTDQAHSTTAMVKWYKEINVLYVIAQPSTVTLDAVFGKGNAARLKAVFTKYTGSSK